MQPLYDNTEHLSIQGRRPPAEAHVVPENGDAVRGVTSLLLTCDLPPVQSVSGSGPAGRQDSHL